MEEDKKNAASQDVEDRPAVDPDETRCCDAYHQEMLAMYKRRVDLLQRIHDRMDKQDKAERLKSLAETPSTQAPDTDPDASLTKSFIALLVKEKMDVRQAARRLCHAMAMFEQGAAPLNVDGIALYLYHAGQSFCKPPNEAPTVEEMAAIVHECITAPKEQLRKLSQA